jgi:shikimate kinase
MGAGKTTAGQALAKHLGWSFEDLDQRIERRERRKVAEIFGESGESGFRRAEHAALKELLSELPGGKRRIVAFGGGTFAQSRNAKLVKAGGVPTVFLDAAAAELWRRCRRQAAAEAIQRPLLGNLAEFRALYETRRPHYLKASITLTTGSKTVAEIAVELANRLGLRPGSKSTRAVNEVAVNEARAKRLGSKSPKARR